MILQRLKEDEYGTHGELLSDQGKPIGVYTLEHAWKENAPNVSCIPVGEYRCSSYSSDHFKDVWQVKNVPGRIAILIHAGNSLRDTHGCILVGMRPSKEGVGQSQAALIYLRSLMPPDFTLLIRGIGKKEALKGENA